MEMNWKNMQVSMPISTNYRSSCLQVTENRTEKQVTDFGKFPVKQSRWSPILAQLHGLKYF